MPPIRTLAEQLVINPNTVARAYLELEREGVVNKRHGSGTYVAQAASPLSRREKLKVLGQRTDALLAEAAHLDVSLDDLVELMNQHHREMHNHSHR